MRKITLSLFIVLIMVLPLIPVQANYDKTYATPEGHFNIHYTTDSTNEPDNATTNSAIISFGALLEQIWTDELSYGFDTPSNAETYIYEQGINGHGKCGYMDFDPWFLGNTWNGPMTPPLMPTLVALHEIFHMVQGCYTLSNHGGKWVTEGQARSLQDKLYSDMDALDGTEFAGYVGQVNGYLKNPSRTLMDLSYDAALWWTYITEQYGTTNTEPDRGLDALVNYWGIAETFGSAIDYKEVFNFLFATLGAPSMTFEEVFKDYVISLLGKDLSGSSVPAKYKYIDETQPPGKYRELVVNFNETIVNGQTKGGTDFIDSYAPKYYVVRPDNEFDPLTGQDRSFNIEVRVDQITENDLFFDLITIKDDDIVDEIRVTGENFVRTISTDVDQIVLVVAGIDNEHIDPAKYIWTFSTGAGVLIDIQSPENADGLRARAGDITDPEKILVIADVITAGKKVKGLIATDFTATIGTEVANVLTATNIYGLYFIEIQAPTQTLSQKYDLTINFAGTSVTVPDSVDYSDLAIDASIIIDKSGSMASTEKIDASMAAAGLFVNSFLNADQISLVEFATDATLLEGLDDVSIIRGTVLNKIENIIANGPSTSVGDGLFVAQNELFTNGNATHPNHIILLTDGQENEPLTIADVDNYLWDNGTILHVILIGIDAEAQDLQNVAKKTGGSVHFAFDPNSGTLASSLAEIYRGISERLRHKNRVFSNMVETTGTWNVHELTHVSQSREATFTLSYKSENSLPSDFVEVKLPDNSVISPTFHDENNILGNSYYGHYIFHLSNPSAGNYAIQSTSSGSGNVEYYAEVAVRSPISINMLIGLESDPYANIPDIEKRVIGNEVPILATLTDDKGPILNAEVSASVITGTSYTDFQEWNLHMYDDGAHGDGFANDGIYGNLFTRTGTKGTYIVDVHASGTSSSYGAFTREMSESFHLFEIDRFDADFDTLPDVWEKIHGLNFLVGTGDDGPTGDPDGEGLSNEEELKHGTNPNLVDTDKGGESDLSEVNNGRDPYNPIDDFFGPPILQGHASDNRATIEFSVKPSYSSLNLYRSTTNGSTGFSLIQSNLAPNGIVQDSPLTNGVKYYYRMEAIGLNGEVSGYSESVMIIPNYDVQAPAGTVIINNGDNTTNSVNVNLNLFTEGDATEMRISQDPTFIGVSWKPYKNKTSFILSGTGIQFVYAQFKDVAGNAGGDGHGEGLYSFDGIRVDPGAIISSSSSSSSSSSTSITSSPGFTLLTVGLIIIVTPLILLKRKIKKI